MDFMPCVAQLLARSVPEPSAKYHAAYVNNSAETGARTIAYAVCLRLGGRDRAKAAIQHDTRGNV